MLKLPGFRPAAMQGRHDCGPTALYQVLRYLGSPIDRGSLRAAWGFARDCDRLDTPGHHLRLMRRLGMPCVMRRRMGWPHIAAALGLGRPVVFLAPRGALRWHWLVIAGGDGERLVVSCGDGVLRQMPSHALLASARRHPVARLLGVEALGYATGVPDAFGRDVVLERDQLTLAGLAEQWLAPVEPVWEVCRRLCRKTGWKRRVAQDILSSEMKPAIPGGRTEAGGRGR